MKQVPIFSSDEEAEAFLDQDLSDLDFSRFRHLKIVFKSKVAHPEPSEDETDDRPT